MKKFRLIVGVAVVVLAVGALLMSSRYATSEEDFRSRFTAEVPAGVVEPGYFMEYGARIKIVRPVQDKPLDAYAVRNGVCRPDEACAFRLSTVLFLEFHQQKALIPIGLRYLLEDRGTRVEGYAHAPRVGVPFTFLRRRGDTWVALTGAEAAAEEAFVSATAMYVAAQ